LLRQTSQNVVGFGLYRPEGLVYLQTSGFEVLRGEPDERCSEGAQPW
jgi:hypothetical protein